MQSWQIKVWLGITEKISYSWWWRLHPGRGVKWCIFFQSSKYGTHLLVWIFVHKNCTPEIWDRWQTWWFGKCISLQVWLFWSILGIYVRFQRGYTASPMVSFEENLYMNAVDLVGMAQAPFGGGSQRRVATRWKRHVHGGDCQGHLGWDVWERIPKNKWDFAAQWWF